MNLKFSINKEGKKVYTLKDSIDNKKTEEAHYKFLKFDRKPKDNLENQ